MHQWFVYTEFNEASKAAADFLSSKIKASIAKKDICHVILPGGNTPAICLAHLAEKKLPWNKIHWYPGDERCYPLGHAERNDVMLEKNLWSQLPDTHIHTIPAELGAEQAADIYREIIKPVDNFDIAFLGMG
ncbi:MAG: 6-phosphogluconolactonase, partial [Gammaproteobacteria bacterium]|nr:6-phosphogluconolactonase [Gammaproteobacteria bacterium]